MTFRQFVASAGAEILHYIRGKSGDTPRSGQSWQVQQVACASKCLFKGIAVSNKGATGFWVWVCDDSGEGTKPTLAPLYVPSTSTFSLDWSECPRRMMNGIYVCATSDPLTKTLITGADAWFEVAYEFLPQ